MRTPSGSGLETFVDWFAGIGGFRLAGEANGLKCVGACENDKWARQTYKDRFGHEPEFGDAREVNAGAVPDHDLYCAGFPCQSFSTAGKKLGFNDARGTLFFEICRVLEAKQPNYVLLENVKGLLLAPFRDESGQIMPETTGWVFYRILETLGDLGYTVQWQVLDSRHWVAQHRERTYIVGSSRAVPVPEVFPLFDAAGKVAQDTGVINLKGNLYGKGQAGRVHSVDGLSPTLDTRNQNAIIDDDGPWRSNPLGNVSLWSHPPSLNGGKHQGQTGRVYGPGSISPTIDTGRSTLVDAGHGLRVLTPVERERLMGFPDGWTDGVSDAQRFRQTGNAVVTKVASAIISRLVECHANGGRRADGE